jgi:hypothetical protein
MGGTKGGRIMRVSDRTADGSVFGPFYPAALQPTVDHAERLWALVAVHELTPPSGAWEAAWLVGRSEEIARVASDVLTRWRDGKMRDEEAAADLEAYVVDIHRGLAERLGCHAPACCRPTNDRRVEPSGVSTRDATIEDGVVLTSVPRASCR